MRHLSLLCLLFYFLPATIPNALAKDWHWPVEIFDVMDNQQLVFFLGDKDIAASPQWQPADGGPPLTIAAVLEHAKRWITKESQLTGAVVHEIELKPIHKHEREHRWYYLLQLRTVKDGKPKAHYLAVLFNGKVVPAIVKPSAIK